MYDNYDQIIQVLGSSTTPYEMVQRQNVPSTTSPKQDAGRPRR